MAIVVKGSNLADDLANDLVFLHWFLGFHKFPRGVAAIDINGGVGDGFSRESRPAFAIQSSV